MSVLLKHTKTAKTFLKLDLQSAYKLVRAKATENGQQLLPLTMVITSTPPCLQVCANVLLLSNILSIMYLFFLNEILTLQFIQMASVFFQQLDTTSMTYEGVFALLEHHQLYVIVEKCAYKTSCLSLRIYYFP